MEQSLSISHTAKTTFQRCNKEYFFRYIARLEPKEKPKAIRMGSAFSLALEHWDANMVDTWYSSYHRKDPKSQFYTAIEQRVVKIMAAAYMDRYEPHQRELEVPEVMIGACKFMGHIDGVMPEGKLIEDKLKGRWSPEMERVLPTDDQVTGYFAMFGMYTGRDADHMEMAYRVTLKPGLRQYKPSKTRPNGESDDEYVARIAADVAGDPNKYFIEIPQTRSEDEILGWWKTTRKVARQIETEATKDVDDAWPENRSACLRYNSVCEFYDICNARTDDEIDVAMMDLQVREKSE